MTDAQVTLLMTFLVQLRAENLAMRKELQTRGPGSAGMDALIDEQRRRLLDLPKISKAIQTGDHSLLEGLLDTLSTARPE